MKDIKVSIITASYNYQDYIKEAIESVLAQSYLNWELIIVDDGSSDDSINVINSYVQKDIRIKLFTHENKVNKGLIETIKLGLIKAQGDWIAFLESDDKFHPDCLKKKIDVIKENPDIKFIFSDYEMFGDNDEIAVSKKAFYDKNKKLLKNSGLKDLSKQFIKRNPVATFSIVMLKKEILETLDFNTPVKPLLDYYLWAQFFIKNKGYYINEKLTFWRMHKSSYVHNKNVDTKDFKNAIYDILSTNFSNRFTISLIKLKELRKSIIKLKLGKTAYLKVFNKYIFTKGNVNEL